MDTITAMPNQSMPDVILQGCGSLEAAWQFCVDNNIAISDIPIVGTEYQVTSDALTLAGAAGTATLQYLQQNLIVLGTLGAIADEYVTEDGSDGYETEDGADGYIPTA